MEEEEKKEDTTEIGPLLFQYLLTSHLVSVYIFGSSSYLFLLFSNKETHLFLLS